MKQLMENHRGLIRSCVMHLCLWLLFIYGLPKWAPDTPPPTNIVAVEVINVADITNVKPHKVTPTKKPVVEKPVVEQTLPPPAKTDTASVPKEEVEITYVPLPVRKQKPVELKQKELATKPIIHEKPKEQEPDLFASVLKSVDAMKQQQEASTDEKEQEETVDFSVVEDFLSGVSSQNTYKEGLPLTVTEKEAIRQQIIKHWTILSGASGAKDMKVTLRVHFAPDGAVKSIDIKDKSRYQRDDVFRAIADSAIRAVYKSSPLKNLPTDKYASIDGWREIDLTFDPSDVLF